MFSICSQFQIIPCSMGLSIVSVSFLFKASCPIYIYFESCDCSMVEGEKLITAGIKQFGMSYPPIPALIELEPLSITIDVFSSNFINYTKNSL